MRLGKQFYNRLTQLEQISAKTAKFDAPDPGPSAVDELREWLREYGFEPQGNESLAQVTARALGMSCRELKARLEAGSWG